MEAYTQLLQKVKKHLTDGDLEVGYRRLLDAVMETENMPLYNQAIQLTAWKEQQADIAAAQQQLVDKCMAVIEQLSSFDIVPADRSQPVIAAQAIRKTYRRNNFSLGPVDTSIKKGSVYGLVGENGNGKTTLLRILAKELSHDDGDLKYFFNTASNNEFELRSKLVYIPQRTKTWYGSLKDNLRFVLASYQTPVDQIEPRMHIMIARLGLWKYQELNWSELSSGYKMRFELVRTLLRQPEVMLLDEPLANLDVLAQQIVLDDLIAICNSIRNPVALILSSQQLYEVEKVADKVIYLKEGKYRDNLNNAQTEAQELIIELETKSSREDLYTALERLQLDKIMYNAGVYIIHLPKEVKLYQVMEVLAKDKLDVVYLRDISRSTRRFFVAS